MCLDHFLLCHQYYPQYSTSQFPSQLFPELFPTNDCPTATEGVELQKMRFAREGALIVEKMEKG